MEQLTQNISVVFHSDGATTFRLLALDKEFVSDIQWFKLWLWKAASMGLLLSLHNLLPVFFPSVHEACANLNVPLFRSVFLTSDSKRTIFIPFSSDLWFYPKDRTNKHIYRN